MKKITYHPLMKLLTVLLFIASVEGALLFAYETAVSLAGDYRDSLTVYFFRWRFYFPVLLIFTIALVTAALTLLVLLCMGAGRSHRDEGVRLSAFYKIPLDLYLAAISFCCAALGAMTGDLIYGYALDESTVIAYWAIFLIPAFSLILALTLMSICARFRAGTWWRNNVITYVLRLVWRVLRRCWKVFKRICGVLGRGLGRAGRRIWSFVSEIPSVPLAILFSISVFFLVLISVFLESGHLVVVTGVYAVGGILLGAIFSRRLERGAQKLAQGDLETRLDVSNLFGTYRRHAEHLNHIREGMSNAVEAQLRSERMKTELITNVSHDIKTPLTSIINYVDLMKKEQIESEKVREYLEVMDRQSIRLKKLIEDLMEVSKASTGNIALEMADTDFDVMLEQILGEYRERLTKAELNLCVDNAAKGAHIMADGKLLWRVFDNLLGNICKYSMPGTRVYLNVARHDEMLEISMRNISLYSLNITSEELMERFVRGDRSRHTEGSGLGLSIAKNLVELQKGNLEIVVDGDLFKAIVRFPLL